MSADRSNSNPWPKRLIALGVIVLIHAVVFYIVVNERAKTAANADNRQAFTPVPRETGGSAGSLAEGSQPKSGGTETPPDSHWSFEPFDVWPSAAASTPTTDSAPNEKRRATLREPVDASNAFGAGLSIVNGPQPEYPLAWARAGEDGSVFFDVRIDEQGKPAEIKLTRSSASSRLQQSAQRAVSSWMFSAPVWHSRPVPAAVEVELRFNAYRYQFSWIAAPVADGAVSAPKQPVSSDEEFRRLVSALSSSKPTLATLENTQPEFQKMRTTIIKWGPAKKVRWVNPQESAWQEYSATPEFRSNSEGGTIAVRWDRYDVQHEHVHAIWKIAIDPYERIWAAKADTTE